MYTQSRYYQADSHEMHAFVWHVANSSNPDFRKFFWELSLHVLAWHVCVWHHVLQSVAVCCSVLQYVAVAALLLLLQMLSSGTSQIPQIPIFGSVSCAVFFVHFCVARSKFSVQRI